MAVGPLDSPRLDKELEEIKQEGNWTFETVEGCIRCRKVEQPWPFIDVYATELHVKDGIDVTQSEDNAADHLAEIRYASEAARKKRPDDAWRISKLYPLKACVPRVGAVPEPVRRRRTTRASARARLREGLEDDGAAALLQLPYTKGTRLSRFPLLESDRCRSATRLYRMDARGAAGQSEILIVLFYMATRSSSPAGPRCTPAGIGETTTAPSAQPASTSACTTLFAPTTAPSPTTLGPKTTAPAPTVAL